MSLIDKSYFKFEVNTPDNKYEEIQDYINKYEPEVLRKLLGLELYRLVIAENPGEQRILDLRDGKDYTVDGVLYRWNGLVNDEKISLIAYYVYYWYARLNISSTSVGGEIQITLENAAIANPSLKIQDVWNRLRKLYGSLYEYHNYILNIHVEDYNYDEYYESAYAFLKEHEDDYPEWRFAEIGSVNTLDL